MLFLYSLIHRYTYRCFLFCGRFSTGGTLDLRPEARSCSTWELVKVTLKRRPKILNQRLLSIFDRKNHMQFDWYLKNWDETKPLQQLWPFLFPFALVACGSTCVVMGQRAAPKCPFLHFPRLGPGKEGETQSWSTTLDFMDETSGFSSLS